MLDYIVVSMKANKQKSSTTNQKTKNDTGRIYKLSDTV